MNPIVQSAIQMVGKPWQPVNHASWDMRNIIQSREPWRFFAELIYLEHALATTDALLKLDIESNCHVKSGVAYQKWSDAGKFRKNGRPEPGDLALFEDSQNNAIWGIVTRYDGGTSFNVVIGDQTGRHMAIELEMTIGFPDSSMHHRLIGFICAL